MIRIDYYAMTQNILEFQERTYSTKELSVYIEHALSTPFLEREKLETNRGTWKFSYSTMEKYCKENNIKIYQPNHETMNYGFEWTCNKGRKAWSRLVKQLS